MDVVVDIALSFLFIIYAVVCGYLLVRSFSPRELEHFTPFRRVLFRLAIILWPLIVMYSFIEEKLENGKR